MGLEGQPEREIRCGGTRPNTDTRCKAFLTAIVLDGREASLRFFCRRCRGRSYVRVSPVADNKLYLTTTPTAEEVTA